MRALLDLALQAHGGLERWRDVQSLDVRVSLTGGLYRVKGYPEGVPNVNMLITRSRHSFSTIRGFCSGSIMWPSAQPRTIASTTRPSEGWSSQRFAG